MTGVEYLSVVTTCFMNSRVQVLDFRYTMFMYFGERDLNVIYRVD